MFFNLDQDFLVLYNSLYGSLVLIDRETGEALERGDLPRILSESEAYKRLVDAGAIIEDDFDEDSYLKKLRESMFSGDFVSIFLSLTSKCNLACKYCYQSTRPQIEGEDLTEEKWRILYDYIVKRVEDGSKSVFIALYGGEPLLNPRTALRVIRDLDKLTREYGVRSEVGLITNGTIYSSDVEEIYEQVAVTQITIDGPREVHNERRPFKSGEGSFDTIFNNLLRIVDKHSGKVSLRVNVDEHNADYVNSFINTLADLGLQSKIVSLDITPVYPDQATRYKPFKVSKSYSEYYVEMARRTVELLEYAVNRGFRIAKIFVKGPCLCKFKYGCSIDENLNLYVCPAYIYERPIGRVSTSGLQWDPIIKEEASRDPPCVYSCKYGPICYGGCIYLKSKAIPTCLRVLYGDEYLERLVRAYVFSRYREVIERERNSSS
jgi:uncharacterized protein